jgi:hypothetical protein
MAATHNYEHLGLAHAAKKVLAANVTINPSGQPRSHVLELL